MIERTIVQRKNQMPRTEQDNAIVREQSKAKILMAAMRLFAQRGYEGTSVRMIVEEARISQGLLYNYYSGKEDLLRALFVRSIEDVRQSFAAAQGSAGANSLQLIIRASFAIVIEHFDFWRLSYSLRAQPTILAQLGDDLQRWTAEITQTLEKHLRDAGWKHPEIEAAILFALIDGVSQHYATAPDTYPLNAVIDTLVQRYGGTSAPEEVTNADAD
jgi:AcrR family transcriptional regulator